MAREPQRHHPYIGDALDTLQDAMEARCETLVVQYDGLGTYTATLASRKAQGKSFLGAIVSLFRDHQEPTGVEDLI